MLLSDIDVKKELVDGENIMIYPLDITKIKGSSINLTASKYAWRVSDKKSAVEGDKIVVPPQDTVCVYTEESIWVSRRIGGTYHSKVSLVTKGLGHISTTLDPQWFGMSLIAINNPTCKPVEIYIGHTFVTVMLYYLKTDSTKGLNENAGSRQDLANNFNISPKVQEELRKESNRSFEGLRQAMLNSQSYKDFIEDYTKEEKETIRQKKEFKQTFWFPLIVAILGAIIGGVISGLIVWQITKDVEEPSKNKKTAVEIHEERDEHPLL
ncbi:hypothetical protein [Sporosarcina sp. HYO08]|uniref:dCTP deaminase domain-containing protein n=1 Tax=Sporosarcina sp. HYO08 TaxID=1759557 RepID=UPI0020A3D2CC|nr:hypothetical protein [Sporosarcina sp. HYO08]